MIYNAHNIESAFRGEFDVDSLGDPGRLRRFERGILARSAETWVVSAADARSARELCPDVALRIVPNVVDVASIRPQAPDREAHRILLVGNFGYEPNRLGLRFLVDEVLPLVWRAVPEARLRIVGAGLDGEGEGSSDPRVQAVGFVEEIESAYRNVSCVAVPLLQSGGSPVKFVEAMAYGLPVVATERACAGLTVRDREHCLIATGAPAFADALIEVLREGRAELGVRARRLVEAEYSSATISELVRA